MPVKGILRQAAVLIALVSALGTAAAFMRMARHSVLVVTDEYGVVVRCGFIDHILLRKHIYHIPIKATTAQQVRINPTHILVFLWEHKWFGRLPLDRRRQRQRSSAAAQQKFDRLRIAFAHEAAHKIDGVAALMVILVKPQITSNRDLGAAIFPFVFTAGAFQCLTLPAEQLGNIRLPGCLFLFFCKVYILSSHSPSLPKQPPAS